MDQQLIDMTVSHSHEHCKQTMLREVDQAISPLIHHSILFHFIPYSILLAAQTLSSNVPECTALSSGVDRPNQVDQHPVHPDSHQIQ